MLQRVRFCTVRCAAAPGFAAPKLVITAFFRLKGRQEGPPAIGATLRGIGRPARLLGRAGRSDVENPATESDVECISPEQIHGIHHQQQECSFPPRLSNEKIGSSKQYHRDDAERDKRRHPINNTDEAISCGR